MFSILFFKSPIELLNFLIMLLIFQYLFCSSLLLFLQYPVLVYEYSFHPFNQRYWLSTNLVPVMSTDDRKMNKTEFLLS